MRPTGRWRTRERGPGRLVPQGLADYRVDLARCRRGRPDPIRKRTGPRLLDAALEAPRAGLEPATCRLTAGRSTIELSRNQLFPSSTDCVIAAADFQSLQSRIPIKIQSIPASSSCIRCRFASGAKTVAASLHRSSRSPRSLPSSTSLPEPRPSSTPPPPSHTLSTSFNRPGSLPSIAPSLPCGSYVLRSFSPKSPDPSISPSAATPSNSASLKLLP